jgi:hypothetical protein
MGVRFSEVRTDASRLGRQFDDVEQYCLVWGAVYSFGVVCTAIVALH